MISYDIHVYITYTSISAIYKKYSHYSEKNNGNKKNKRHFNKNERRCRDVKTQKACEQGWEANIVTKIKQTTSIYNPT